MSFWFINATARAAWAAATSQQGQLEGLRDEWAGQMSVRYYSSADAHLVTVTHATPIVDTTTNPRSLRLGAWVAESHVQDGTPAYCILAVPAGADILRCDVSLAGAISDPGGRVRLDIGTRLRVQATASLPSGAVLASISSAPAESWVQLNTNAIEDVFPPDDLIPWNDSTGPAVGPPERVQGAWPCIACHPDGFVIWGGGHANTSYNGVFDWSFTTQEWRLSFHCSEMEETSAVPRYRAVDNGAPVSSHVYGNNVWLTTLGKMLTFGGAPHGDGSYFRIYNGAGVDQGRAAGCWVLDMAQAGLGYVAGSTGSNVKRGAYVGVDLTGANAWEERDWFAQATTHPSRPYFAGSDFNSHVNMGATATVEGGVDVVYYTAGSGTARHLWRVEIRAAAIDDVQTYIAGQGVDNSSQGQGPIALDPVRRVVIKLNNSGNTASGTVQFVDLKRTWGATNEWRAATISGADVAEFIDSASGLITAGVAYSPTKECFVIYMMGRQVWEIYPPNSAAYVDNSNADLTADTGWALVKPTMDTGTTAPRSTYVTDPLLGETGLLGKWQWHPQLGCGIVTFGNASGEVWAYKPTGWTLPA